MLLYDLRLYEYVLHFCWAFWLNQSYYTTKAKRLPKAYDCKYTSLFQIMNTVDMLYAIWLYDLGRRVLGVSGQCRAVASLCQVSAQCAHGTAKFWACLVTNPRGPWSHRAVTAYRPLGLKLSGRTMVNPVNLNGQCSCFCRSLQYCAQRVPPKASNTKQRLQSTRLKSMLYHTHPSVARDCRDRTLDPQ